MATILIAEDNAGFRSVVSLVLGADRHEVHEARDGREAVAYLRDHTPDLVILDSDMPFMDGITVCDRIKRISRLKEIPVIILTANTHFNTQKRARDANANALLHKPLEGKDFRHVVAALLQDSQAYADQLQSESA